MDVRPQMSDAQAIQELEQVQAAAPALWWDAVPVISFEATSKHSKSKDDESAGDALHDSEFADGSFRTLLDGGIVVVLIAIALLILELIRH